MRFDAKRRVRPRGQRAIYPRTLERDYARAIKRRLRAAARALRAELEALAKFRTDSTAGDERAAVNAIGSVKLAYYETYTELVTERLVLETAGKAEAYMNRQFTRQVNSVLGVDPMPTPALRSAALRFAQENVALIRSVEEEYFARLEADIVLALRQGARWEQLAPKISERYKVSGRRAELIARDQMGSLVSQVAQAKQQSAGFDKYIWRNSQDERVVGNPSGHYPQGNDRHGDHWSREGKVFSWSHPPHDGHPGEAINCRCTAEPYWGDEEAGGVGGEVETAVNRSKRAGLNERQRGVVEQAVRLLDEVQYLKFNDSTSSRGRARETHVDGRVIAYEPDAPDWMSGMTDHARQGFTLGPKAYSSEEELKKTLLQELYRLEFSESQTGTTQVMAQSETHDAFTFAEQHYRTAFGPD